MGLLRRAAERYSGKEAADFLERFWSRPASRAHRSAGGSRAARHARLRRIRGLAVAGSYLLACDHPEAVQTLLEPGFTALRPWSPLVFTRLRYLIDLESTVRTRSTEALWNSAAAEVLVLATRLPKVSAEEVLRFEGALAGLHAAALIAGPALPNCWEALWSGAEDRGLLQHPFVRMRLSSLGSRMGRCDSHVEWLMEPRARAFDLADSLRFVRTDGAEEVLEQVVASARCRQDEVAAWVAVVSDHPLGTWLRLAEHVRTCMRTRGEFDNPGLVLMVLNWVGALRAYAGARRGRPPSVRARLLRELAKIDAVKAIEVRRFRAVLAGVPEGALRRRLVQLWATPH
jgi:hypothetical protein